MLPRILSIFLLGVFIPSCTIDNKRGEAGSPGVNGKDGTNGTNGTNGKDGLNGVAAVVYDTFDQTQACTNSGQMIFVSGDKTFYVCQEQKWVVFSIKGDHGEAGKNGIASVVTDDVDFRASCSQPGQLIYDRSTKDFYSCQSTAWQKLSIKGDQGNEGIATVVFDEFDASLACRQKGQLIFDTTKKTFFYCSNSKWQELNIRGTNGTNGTDGKNGQTLFVANASQLPPCAEDQLGFLYILTDSGSVSVCTSVDGKFDWKSVYEAPAKVGPVNQSLIDDCIAATGERRNFYLGMLANQFLLKSTAPDYTTVCPKLAEAVRDARSWNFDQSVSAITVPTFAESILTDDLVDILKFFPDVRNISFEYSSNFALTSLDKMPSLPKLRSLAIPHNVTFSLGKLDKFPELVSLDLSNASIIGENGQSPFVHIENLTKLHSLSLLNTRLTVADLKEIAKLKNLRTLRVGNTPADLSALAGMDSLAELIFIGDPEKTRCPFTDKTRCR